jgi:orotidine-5'-phosphate decarboxylase
MSPQNLSQKPIPVSDRLIFAMDFPSFEEGKRWANLLGDSVTFYKLGWQMFLSGDYFSFVDWLSERGKKVFADLKIFDVPETVRNAVQQLKDRNVTFATVHGNEDMLRAAVESKNNVKILAVTVLTSLDRKDLEDLGFQCDVADLVLSRARRALKVGCDGVISSGLEAARLRDDLGNAFLVISPGIRPVDNARVKDDQKRVVDLEDAFRNGADYIVVGRPIRKAENPRAVAESYQERIARLFSPT